MKNIIYNSLILGAFLISTQSKAQHLLEALEGGTSSIKCLERVKDKHYGDGVHNFIYCAVMGPNGKKWLNLNLGAEYAREPTPGHPNPHFNPEAQPTDEHDWKAFGSLFQEGRDADGHELVNYRKGSEFWQVSRLNGAYYYDNAPTYVKRPQLLMDPDNYPTPLYLDYNTWGGNMYNNPCPTGYRVVNTEDVEAILTGSNISLTGHEKGTILIINSVYPNLTLMVSPSYSWHVSQLTAQAINDREYLDTVSGLVSGTGSTASIWAVLPQSLADSTIKSRYRYRKNLHDAPWLDNNNMSTTTPPPTRAYILDSGVWHDGKLFGIVGTGPVGSPLITLAIRCVEK